MSAVTFESCQETSCANNATRQDIAQNKAQAVSFISRCETGLHTINGNENIVAKANNVKVLEKPALYACNDLKGC